MGYNFITNINGCIESATQMMGGNLQLVYYSHIPVAIASILIGFFVILKNRKVFSAKVLFFLSIIFSLWILANLISWVSSSSVYIMFSWSLLGILDSLLYISCFFLIFSFKSNDDIPLKMKYLFGFLTLPIIILTPTVYNLKSFYLTDCTAVDMSFYNYIFYLKIFTTVSIVLIAFYKYFKSKTKEEKKERLVFSIGIALFLISIFGTGFIADTTGKYIIEVYGIFTMTLFMAFIAYLIVKFKTFDIKLIAAQALVWSLVILIGSQFFFIQNNTNKILTAITLIISTIVGYMIVQSVKKENALNEQLATANAGQKNLIHIMNHQIKGYLSTDKNIFAELLTDDYGKVPDEAHEIIAKGLESADNGQKYVTEILKGTSAESGTLSYDMKELDFKKLVSETIAKKKEDIDKKGLKLNLDIGEGNYMVIGDILHLSEAVRNLIDNSIYYTPTGSIFINLSVKGGIVSFKIKDTGVGVKEEDRDKIFKAGGVGNDSIKVNVNSSGYGLVFVKGIIEKHKGKVWFESAGAGHGTTFFVELPVK